MRCKYRFKVEGRLKLAEIIPILCRGCTFELERNDSGVVTYITATINVPDRKEWPTTTLNPKPGVKLGVNIKSPMLPFIQTELRAVEGLLSMYGIDGIDLENPEHIWLPENDAERQALKIFSYKSSHAHLTDAELPFTSFDLVARSFIAAWDARDVEIPLSFFRKGKIDSREHRHIEAFYDYYFVLETVYGGGKSRSSAVASEMKSNDALLSIIANVIADDILHAELDRKPELKKSFEEKYANKTAQEIIDHLVKVRGFLHHHSLKRPDNWHPENHQPFEIDALVIGNIAFGVVFESSEKYIFSGKTIQEYARLTESAAGANRVSYQWF